MTGSPPLRSGCPSGSDGHRTWLAGVWLAAFWALGALSFTLDPSVPRK